MTAIAKELNQLQWLAAALGAHRDKLRVLLGRLTGFGMPGSMKPNVFRKFLRMLDQVASARDKEMVILDQIETVEQRHRFLRAHHQLRQAHSNDPRPDQSEAAEDRRSAKPNRSLLWLLTFVYAFESKAINHKKQGLTVD